MGTQAARDTTGLAAALFPGTKQRVLGILYGRPERSFYANELIGLAASGSGAVQRELITLSQSGLITMKAVGNQKHYQANAASPIFHELRSIIQKTVGLADPLRAALLPLSTQITAAFVYGSIAKQTDTADSDIDLMVISDSLRYGDLFAALEAASTCLGRQINPTILSLAALHERMAQQSAFTTRVMEQPKLWILGEERDLRI